MLCWYFHSPWSPCLLLIMFTSALCWSRSLTTSRWPFSLARCSGPAPPLQLPSSTWAPRASAAFTPPTSPSRTHCTYKHVEEKMLSTHFQTHPEVICSGEGLITIDGEWRGTKTWRTRILLMYSVFVIYLGYWWKVYSSIDTHVTQYKHRILISSLAVHLKIHCVLQRYSQVFVYHSWCKLWLIKLQSTRWSYHGLEEHKSLSDRLRLSRNVLYSSTCLPFSPKMQSCINCTCLFFKPVMISN